MSFPAPCAFRVPYPESPASVCHPRSPHAARGTVPVDRAAAETRARDRAASMSRTAGVFVARFHRVAMFSPGTLLPLAQRTRRNVTLDSHAHVYFRCPCTASSSFVMSAVCTGRRNIVRVSWLLRKGGFFRRPPRFPFAVFSKYAPLAGCASECGFWFLFRVDEGIVNAHRPLSLSFSELLAALECEMPCVTFASKYGPNQDLEARVANTPCPSRLPGQGWKRGFFGFVLWRSRCLIFISVHLYSRAMCRRPL